MGKKTTSYRSHFKAPLRPFLSILLTRRRSTPGMPAKSAPNDLFIIATYFNNIRWLLYWALNWIPAPPPMKKINKKVFFACLFFPMIGAPFVCSGARDGYKAMPPCLKNIVAPWLLWVENYTLGIETSKSTFWWWGYYILWRGKRTNTDSSVNAPGPLFVQVRGLCVFHQFCMPLCKKFTPSESQSILQCWLSN